MRNLHRFKEKPHIHRDGVTGKKFFPPKAEDRLMENSIMVAASFVNRHKQVNKYMVNEHSSSRTLFNMNSVPEMSLKRGLENVHRLIKRLFSTNKVLNVPIAGRLKHFSKAWKKLTRNQSILDLVDGYVIPFQRKPFQSRTPFQWATSREQQKLMDKKVKEMLKKGAIRQASTVKGGFLSNLFLILKNNGGTKASNKPETSKCVYTIQSLQNRKIAKSEIFIIRGRLYVQARSKRCILLRSFTENLEEIRLAPLVRKLI